MRQNHRINGMGIFRQILIYPSRFVAMTLVHAHIEEQPQTIHFDEMTASGNRAVGAAKLDSHDYRVVADGSPRVMGCYFKSMGWPTLLEMSEDQTLTLPKAILFDMDGTLTEDRIDFTVIRQRLGLGDVAILEAVLEMTGAERERAEAILHQWEDEHAVACQLNEGCIDLLDWLTARNIRTALITRNSRRSVETVLERHGLSFEVRITREDGKFKPHPDPLWAACTRLDVKPEEAWMVGDWKYDIEAGNAAGIRTVWLSYDRERPFEAVPWRSVRDLCELRELLESAKKPSTTSGV